MGIMEDMHNASLAIPHKTTRRDPQAANNVNPSSVEYDFEPGEGVQEVVRTREETSERLSISSRSIGTEVTQVMPFSETRRELILRNASAADIYIGSSLSLSLSNCYVLGDKERLRLPTSAAVYAFAPALVANGLGVVEVFD